MNEFSALLIRSLAPTRHWLSDDSLAAWGWGHQTATFALPFAFSFLVSIVCFLLIWLCGAQLGIATVRDIVGRRSPARRPTTQVRGDAQMDHERTSARCSCRYSRKLWWWMRLPEGINC